MKTDEEMVQSIRSRVAKAAARREKNKKTAARIGAGLLCMTIAAGAVLGGGKLHKAPKTAVLDETATEATADPEQVKPQRRPLTLLVASAAETVPVTPVRKSALTLPIHGFLAVEPIAGKTYAQIEAIQMSYKEQAKALGADWGCTAEQTEKTMFVFVLGEQLIIRADDADALESLTLSCTQNGSLRPWAGYGASAYPGFIARGGQALTLTGDEYRAECCGKAGGTEDTRYGFRFHWFLSKSLQQAFDADPALTPAAVSDTVTVAAAYTDGTSERFVINLSFDGTGTLTATCFSDPAE